jgi:predicted TIM-barrel fold metal-dependent hydrolase
MIDAHVHLWTRAAVRASASIRAALAYFRVAEEQVPADMAGLVAALDEGGVRRAFLLALNCEASPTEALRRLTVSNEDVAGAVREHPDLFVGFASVDPRRGDRAVAALEEAARLGLVGLKIHASAVETYPHDKARMFPLYEKAQDLGMRVIHHTGTTALGNCRIRFARPVYLDDVAQAFPDLPILAAHFGWPWMHECFAVLQRNPNVFTDLSGWAPRYLPDAVVAMVNGPFKDRTLVGSDFPMLAPAPWREEFERVVVPKLKDGVAERLLEGNARRFLER